MGGKVGDAEAIGEYLGTGGEFGELTYDFLLFRAADRIGISAIELEARPDAGDWITRASSIVRGENIGKTITQKAQEQRNKIK